MVAAAVLDNGREGKDCPRVDGLRIRKGIVMVIVGTDACSEEGGESSLQDSSRLTLFVAMSL